MSAPAPKPQFEASRFEGGLVARLRQLWFSVAGRHAQNDLVGQLNQTHSFVAHQLHALDQQQSEQQHDLGEATVQIAQLKQQIELLTQRVAALEQQQSE